MFSIVVPLYNKECSIERTIQSVLQQSFLEFEILVVNDGSTDASASVVEKITDKRLRLIQQANKGVSASRNKGIKEAKYEWIAFLDGDDIWNEQYLESMKKLIEDFPKASFFGCQYAKVFDDEMVITNECHQERGYIKDFFKATLKANLVTASTIVVNKNCFEEVGFFNTKYSRGEDLDMWIRLSEKFTLAFEPTLLAYYYQDTENRTSQNVKPLKEYFYDTNLKGKNYKTIYLIGLGETLMREMWNNKKYGHLMKLIVGFRLSSIKMLNNIVRKKLTANFIRQS